MSKRPVPPKFVPTVEQYIAGFRSIEPEMAEGQRRMLINHHNAPCHIMTSRELALSVGYGERAANLQYGKLGQMLSKAMGLDEYWAVETLALLVPVGVGENEHLVWVLRENVVRALEEIGWASKTSDFFFPFGNRNLRGKAANEDPEAVQFEV